MAEQYGAAAPAAPARGQTAPAAGAPRPGRRLPRGRRPDGSVVRTLPTVQAAPPRPADLAWLVNEALIEQARRHGMDLCVKVKPVLGGWEIPHIASIGSVEQRSFAELAGAGEEREPLPGPRRDADADRDRRQPLRRRGPRRLLSRRCATSSARASR